MEDVIKFEKKPYNFSQLNCNNSNTNKRFLYSFKHNLKNCIPFQKIPK